MQYHNCKILKKPKTFLTNKFWLEFKEQSLELRGELLNQNFFKIARRTNLVETQLRYFRILVWLEDYFNLID